MRNAAHVSQGNIWLKQHNLLYDFEDRLLDKNIFPGFILNLQRRNVPLAEYEGDIIIYFNKR